MPHTTLSTFHRDLSWPRALLISVRPEQWLKNVFVFLPLIFSRHLLDLELLVATGYGFICLCLASSGVYLFNDVIDIEADRNHPIKSRRPVAAGTLSLRSAVLSSVVLMAAGLAGSYLLNTYFLLIVLAYLAINLLYTLRLKHLVILDILVIALGFILRVMAGTVLVEVRPSDWLILCTLTLALFLGFSKRRQELILIGESANHHRKVLEHYSIPFLDQMISVATACTVISYTLYTVSDETVARFGSRNLIFTVPFVLYGIFRYLYLTYHKETGDNPSTVIWSDWPFCLNALLWVGLICVLIY